MLTGKYDMSVLREIARIEEGALEDLVQLFGVGDEDDLPVQFDIHEYIGLEDGDRRQALVKLLVDCPSPTDEWINKFLDKIRGLNPHL
ncbi:unnamed protein product [Phaeothamnion confervicola]